jgi:hypothetical protein
MTRTINGIVAHRMTSKAIMIHGNLSPIGVARPMGNPFHKASIANMMLGSKSSACGPITKQKSRIKREVIRTWMTGTRVFRRVFRPVTMGLEMRDGATMIIKVLTIRSGEVLRVWGICGNYLRCIL